MVRYDIKWNKFKSFFFKYSRMVDSELHACLNLPLGNTHTHYKCSYPLWIFNMFFFVNARVGKASKIHLRTQIQIHACNLCNLLYLCWFTTCITHMGIRIWINNRKAYTQNLCVTLPLLHLSCIICILHIYMMYAYI